MDDISFTRRLARLQELSGRDQAAGLVSLQNKLREAKASETGGGDALTRIDAQLWEVEALLAKVDTDQP
jgi:hypothetical protein